MKLHALRTVGRGKQVAIFVIGQALIVGVAVWLHGTLLLSVSEQTLAFYGEQMLSDDVYAWAEDAGLTESDVLPAAEELDTLLNSTSPPDCAVTRVNHDWLAVAADDVAGESPTPLSWLAEPKADAELPHILQGLFDTPRGPRLALAWRLGDDSGFALFHRPRGTWSAAPGEMGGNLLALRIITLVWTTGILGLLTYMMLSKSQDAHREQRQQADMQALRQARQLVRTRDGIVFALATITDSRDPDTGAHLERICLYSAAIARGARSHPRFAAEINDTFIRNLSVTAALHDIGKVGIPDRILRKPGVLNKEEREEMRTHTTIGGECLAGIARRVGDDGFVQMASDIAIAHHEHWDGTGYPRGLKGDEIPLAARIAAIADVYDALRSTRPYKPSLEHGECMERIERQSGRHFDPEMVVVCQEIHETLRIIGSQSSYGLAAGDIDRSIQLDPLASDGLSPTTEDEWADEPEHRGVAEPGTSS